MKTLAFIKKCSKIEIHSQFLEGDKHESNRWKRHL